MAVKRIVERTRVAVIGCGYWGKNLVRNFTQLGGLAAVCDESAEGRKRATEIAPGVDIVADPDDVVGLNVDGIVVSTPAETHYELAKKALESGKDVFVEKPLALSYSEGEELVRLAEKQNRILMVGHVLEYHPAIVRLVSLVRDPGFGKVQYIYSNRLSLGKIRREENILWSFAPHDIAIVLRILGSLPLQVIACGGSYVQANVADVTLTHLLFDNGVRAYVHVSWLHPFKEQRLVVVGSRKMVTYDDVEKRLLLYDQRVELKEGGPVPLRGSGEQMSFDSVEPLRLECQAFLDAIRTRHPPRTDGWSGLHVLKVLRASQRSLMMNGEPVVIPSDTLQRDELPVQL